MKHVMILGDGMADRPLTELGGKTPLQVADKSSMDWIAANGRTGMLDNVPNGFTPNSDVAIMSILGYNPEKYYTGRGPLEAAGMDVELGAKDMAFRCNLITEKNGFIDDYSAGHVSTREARELIDEIGRRYEDFGDFYVGVDYRHLFVLRNAGSDVEELVSTPPHEVVGEKYRDNLMKPEGLELAKEMNRMILSSKDILSDHPVNRDRLKRDEKPANSIWLWGEGRKPSFEPFSEKYGVRGAVISAVTLVKGLGYSIGMDKIDVPGATGYYDTSYENKAKYGLNSLEEHDLVFIHVEAPDEAGHAGDIERKIKAIENLDRRLIKNVLEAMDEDFTISILVDHATPIDVKNHVSDPVPFAVYSTEGESDDTENFDEDSAGKGSKGILKGHKFIEEIIKL